MSVCSYKYMCKVEKATLCHFVVYFSSYNFILYSVALKVGIYCEEEKKALLYLCPCSHSSSETDEVSVQTIYSVHASGPYAAATVDFTVGG